MKVPSFSNIETFLIRVAALLLLLIAIAKVLSTEFHTLVQ
jgi:hypothetical protein